MFEIVVDKFNSIMYNKGTENEREEKKMKTMGFNQLDTERRMGRKIYWRNGYAWVAKYYTSKPWWPFDWYLVKIDLDN